MKKVGKNMKIVRQFIVVLGLLCSLYSIIYAEPYHDKRFHLHFEVPDNWLLQESEKRHIIPFKHEELVSTFNVSVFYFSEPVTVNGLQIRRMNSKYDGWINMKERQGKDYETARANMEDSYVAVYGKNQIIDDFSVKRLVVGEYYYIKGNWGYVISMETYQSLWKDVKEDLRTIVDSFWTGEGERPQVTRKYIKSDKWGMVGKGSNNLNYIVSRLNLTKKLEKLWAFESGIRRPIDTKNTQPLLVTDSAVYFSLDRHLFSVSTVDGRLNWKYKLQGDIPNSLLYQDDILYVINRSNKSELIALLAQNGSVLYKVPIQYKFMSDPIYSKDSIFQIQGSELVSYLGENGQEKWRYDYGLNSSIYPTIYQDMLAVVSKDNMLMVCNKDSGVVNWRKKIGGKVLYAPLIVNDKIVMAVRKLVSGHYKDVVMAISVQGGDVQWEMESLAKSRISKGLSYGNNMVYVLTTESNADDAGLSQKDQVVSLQIEDGGQIWTQDVERLKGTTPLRPLVTDKLVYVKGHYNNRSAISAMDIATGEKISHVFINSVLESLGVNQVADVKLLGEQLYILTHLKDGVKLLCEK